ncbi:MAG: anion permease [Candidatus Nanohaloarchaea archaeon]
MIDILVLVALLASVFMGVSIGASTVASAFGPVNSAHSANVLRSALIAGILALAGAMLQGGNVTQTVGSGLLTGGIGVLQAASVLLVAAVLVIVSVLGDYPMPTAFTVIGAVIGSGLGFGNAVNWSSVARIVGYWAVIPVLALAMGFIISKLLRNYVSRENSEREIRYMLLAVGCYVAYSAGASAVGLAVGPLSSLDFSTTWLLMLGGLSILLGAWLYSPRIIRAISFDYSNIGPRRSIAALGTAALLAQVGIFFGIPISFNEAIIASVIGSGMVEGGSNVDKKKIGYTVSMWVAAFFIAAGATFLLGRFLI